MPTRPFRDLTGQTFGRLTILERAPNKLRPDGKRTTMWKCHCSCGVIKDISAHSLKNGCTLSCSCLNKENLVKKRSPLPDMDRLYNLKRYEAQRRNLILTLSREEFASLVLSSCHYCGLPPSQTYVKIPGTKPVLYSGIDRVENSIGYTPENSVPCCTHCNQMKLAYSYDAFLEKIKSIYNKLCIV